MRGTGFSRISATNVIRFQTAAGVGTSFRALSTDGATLNFTVPDFTPGAYEVWVENENLRESNKALFTLTSAGTIAAVPVVTPPTKEPTPTAAAHRLTQPFVEAKGRVRSHMQHLSLRLTAQLDRLHHTLLADIHHLDYLVTAQHAQWASRIHALAHRVELANPLSKLRQGYSITRRQNSGAVLRSVQHVGIGDSLNTEWIDGHVISQVTQRYEN